MCKRVLAGICLISVALLGQTTVHQLKDVTRVYVGTFGDAFGADLIRSKVIAHLVKSHRIEVVENEEQADAILTGAGQVTSSHFYSASATTTNASAQGGTRYQATAGIRLLSKDSKILWADDATNGRFYRSATSNIADKITKSLLKAIAEDEKR
jgi:hypothetical protein